MESPPKGTRETSLTWSKAECPLSMMTTEANGFISYVWPGYYISRNLDTQKSKHRFLTAQPFLCITQVRKRRPLGDFSCCRWQPS